MFLGRFRGTYARGRFIVLGLIKCPLETSDAGLSECLNHNLRGPPKLKQLEFLEEKEAVLACDSVPTTKISEASSASEAEVLRSTARWKPKCLRAALSCSARPLRASKTI